MSAGLPRVDHFALGGTIASARPAGTGSGAGSGPGGGPGGGPGAVPVVVSGAVPVRSAEDLGAAVPGLAAAADVRHHQVSLAPSAEITVPDLAALAGRMREAAEAGARGMVVTQGTDTLEETAFVLDLLWDRAEPVVVTGAMRLASDPGADGPANLLAAVQVAASPQARDAGVLVCLDDQIHAARHVHKTHTSRPSSFASPGLGPVGWVSEGRAVLALRPTGRTAVPIDPGAGIPAVGLVATGLGDDGRLLRAAAGLGYAGLVLQAMGGGHVPTRLLPDVDTLVRRMPVVLASRCGAGEVLSGTYGFPGSESDLLRRGLIRAGALDGPKSRLLLTLCLAAGYTRDRIGETFTAVGGTTGPVLLPPG